MKTSLPNVLTVIALLLIPLLTFGQAPNQGASTSFALFTVAGAFTNNDAVALNPLSDCLITGNSSICPGQTVQLCAPALADAYSWSNGDTTRCTYVNLPGTYTVTVTYVGGAVSTCSKTITLNEETTCEITGNTTLCQGQTTQLCAPEGAVDYWWSTGEQTRCISVSSPGTYSLTLTTEGSCKSFCSKTVTLSPTSCEITVNSPKCVGQSTELCVPTGALSYRWNTGATTNCITVNTTGNYSVTVTNAAGCTSICSKTVTIGQVATCQITGNDVICPGQTTKLCADLAGASDYWWITGAQTQCIDVTTAGTYSVTITDANGCKSECTKIVTLSETATCQITETVICPGQSTRLCAPLAEASDYWWITGAQTQCIDVTTSGTYSITITDANGCKSECTKIVTMGETANCQITETVICPGQKTKLCADLAGASDYWWITGAQTQCIDVTTAGTYSITITDANGCKSECTKIVTMGETANCQITETVICPGQKTKLCADLAGASDYWWITGAQTQCIDVTTAGTYSVTITDANGCKTECTKIVTMGETANCQITETVICPGQKTKLCADLAGASDYWWITGAQTQCIDVTTAGTYSVTITDANGCKTECTKIVTMGETANCQITETVICPGKTTKLCADLAGASDYWWITGAQTQCIDVTTAGTYSVTVTDANGCKSECTKIVTIGETPNCQITGQSVICPGQTTKLCAALAGASDYWWITGAQTQCIDVSTAGTYSITITDANGCKSECTKIVTMSEGATACQITGDEVISPGKSTQLCVSSGALTYLWSTGATTNCIAVNATGTYSVTVTYAGGCTSVCSKTVAMVSGINCIITGNDFICPGRLAQLCAPALAEAYLWSTGDTTRCIHVSSAGTYSVTVTYVGGLVRTCIKTIGVNEDNTCEITGDTLLCLGKTTRLCAPEGAIDYWWSTGEQTRCIDVAALGTYSLTLTTSGGCVSYCSKTVTRCPAPLNFSEKSIVKEVVERDGNLLLRIYPNPLYAKTMVEFQNTESDSHVLIEIYSSTGSKVSTLFSGDVEKNVQYNTELNAENLAGGIYYCRIVNGRQLTYKKLILIK